MLLVWGSKGEWPLLPLLIGPFMSGASAIGGPVTFWAINVAGPIMSVGVSVVATTRSTCHIGF
jgi:hypothetical protein